MTTLYKKSWLLAPLMLVSSMTQASITLNLTPIVHSGNSLQIDIAISGLAEAAAPSLGAYDFDISFDPSQLSFDHAVFGDSMLGNQLDVFNLGGNFTTADSIGPGLINLSELSLDLASDLDNLQADSFTLATLNFLIVNPGSSTLSLNVLSMADANGQALNVANVATPINTVPLPSAMLLMAPSLIGWAFFGQRKRTQTV